MMRAALSIPERLNDVGMALAPHVDIMTQLLMDTVPYAGRADKRFGFELKHGTKIWLPPFELDHSFRSLPRPGSLTRSLREGWYQPTPICRIGP